MFTTPMPEITFEVVEDFCQEQIEEGVRLDYKADFPKDLAKLLAAFANTYGGLILIGVDDHDRKPVLPIKGVPLQRGLAERVASIGLKGIYPPVFPQVKVCEFPLVSNGAPDRAVVVVRVHQSDQTPHAIENGTRVYLRVDSQSEPFELATVDQIEWLRARREKPLQLRQQLEDLTEGHWLALIAAHAEVSGPLPQTTVRATPVYPGVVGGVQIAATVLADLESRLSPPFVPRGAGAVSYTRREVQGGIALYTVGRDGARYTEINEFGLVLCRTRRPQLDIHVDEVAEYVARSLAFVLQIYKTAGFLGLFDLEIEITRAQALTASPSGHHSLDDTITASYRGTLDEFLEDPTIPARELVNHVRRAFDLPEMDPTETEQFIGSYFRARTHTS